MPQIHLMQLLDDGGTGTLLAAEHFDLGSAPLYVFRYEDSLLYGKDAARDPTLEGRDRWYYPQTWSLRPHVVRASTGGGRFERRQAVFQVYLRSGVVQFREVSPGSIGSTGGVVFLWAPEPTASAKDTVRAIQRAGARVKVVTDPSVTSGRLPSYSPRVTRLGGLRGVVVTADEFLALPTRLRSQQWSTTTKVLVGAAVLALIGTVVWVVK